MDKINKAHSPEFIYELSSGEVFVFGSNLEGRHRGGAAKTAHEQFGAEWGVGDGPTGQCYAIPTMHGGIDEIRPYVDKFLEYAKEHPMQRFLVTRVGCGIAGFTDEEMAPLFFKAMKIINVALPKKWIHTYLKLGMRASKMLGEYKRPDAPEVISEEKLHELTQQYAYPIGAGLNAYVPCVKVRYVKDRDEFGYTTLSECFFFDDGGMYVWESEERWKEDHNQDMVNLTFKDECYGRGYAHRVIFAGVGTGIKDCNGEEIFTGDVIKIGDHTDETFALGTMNDHYAFILDNHCLLLSECLNDKLERIGTVFYQLDRNETPVTTLNQRTMGFQGWYDTTEERNFKKVKARFTPNFDKEDWKYFALDTLGAEFHWNK